MNKLYMVGEIGFEYNDEVYRQPEGGGSKPVKLYRSRQRAEEARAELTFERLESMVKDKCDNLSSYGYSADEIFDVDRLEDYLEEYDLNHFDFGDMDDQFNVNTAFNKLLAVVKDKAKFIKDCLNIKFYDVYEVGMGD